MLSALGAPAGRELMSKYEPSNMCLDLLGWLNWNWKEVKVGTFSADLFSISQEQPSLDQIEVKQMIKGEILLAKCTINIEKDLIWILRLLLAGFAGQ